MKKNLLLIILTAALFACSNNNEQADAFGNFEANPVIVSSEVSGQILKLNIEKGQSVNAGFVAAMIDTVQTALKIKQIDAQKKTVITRRQTIQAQIAVYKEQIKTLQINKNRIVKMLEDGASTQKQFDDISGNIEVIEKQIASTRTQFAAINTELEVLEVQKATTLDLLRRGTVIAPVNGTILETYVEQEELAIPGKPLFKIADLKELILKVYISGAQLPEVKIGQEINVAIDKSETENLTLKGTVTWISSEAEFTPKIIQTKEERVKLVYAVKVAVKNNGTLKIGMPGEVRW